jgi:hypothetical protein
MDFVYIFKGANPVIPVWEPRVVGQATGELEMRGEVVTDGTKYALRLVLVGKVHETLEEGLLPEGGIVEERRVKERVGRLTRRRGYQRRGAGGTTGTVSCHCCGWVVCACGRSPGARSISRGSWGGLEEAGYSRDDDARMEAKERGVQGYSAQDHVLEWMTNIRAVVRHEDDLGREQATHGVADEDDIGSRGCVWLQPGAEVIARHFNGMVALVARIDFGVDDVSVGEKVPEETVDMGREGPEGLSVTIEAMDVDDE